MARIPLDRKLAWAAATDAGNARMRNAGRKAWSIGDYNLACRTFAKLWPDAKEAEWLAANASPSPSSTL